MKLLPSQTNFTAGEISPRLYGHVDTVFYKNGLKEARNCRLLPHGPMQRRNGSQYKAEVKTSSKVVRLVSFQFNQDDAFILEFGDLYIRFYRDGGQITSGGSPYEVVSPYTEAELFEFTYVQFANTLYIAHGSHAPRQLVFTSDADWDLSIINFYPEPTSEEGSKPQATLTPAATTGTGINFTASASSFVEGDIGRQLINLTGNGRASITGFTSNTVVVADILEDFPSTSAIAIGNWKKDLTPVTEITPTGTKIGSIITVDADAIGTTTARDSWRSADVGRFMLFNDGVVEILSLTSANSVKCEVQKTLNSLNETQAWTLEEEAWTSIYGYPRTVGMYEQRLIFGGNDNQPLTIWASETGIFDSMGIGSTDDAALQFDLSSPQLGEINWIVGARDLIIGTSSSEVTINGGAQALTPTNIQQTSKSSSGSNLQQPLLAGNEILFVQRSGRKLESFSYSFDSDSYKANNLTFFAEHLTEGIIKQIAYAQDPDTNIYAVLEDGTMMVGTYEEDQKVLGWTLYSTDGNYESVATISTGPTDEVWVAVKRTINGSTKRYIERFDLSTGEDNLDGFSDAYLTYSNPKTITGITKANPAVVTANSHGFSNGDRVKLIDVGGMTEIIGKTFLVANAATNTFELTDVNGTNINSTGYTTYTSGGEAHKLVLTISGLTYLEGKTVEIKSDGAAHPTKVVSSGSITLDRYSYEVVIGLPYTTTITTLPKEYSLGMGSQQGQPVRNTKPILKVYKSTIPMVNSTSLPARAATDIMDKNLGLVSGNLIYGNQGWNMSAELSIEVSSPFPLILLGIFGAMEAGVL